jgi:CheY-like chemotaxis protein
MRVLLVEDEPYLAEAIRDGLRLEAIAADIAGDGGIALELLRVNAYDIAVLDRDIPGPSGDEIAESIVASGSGMPILMLTAADRLDDKQPGSSSAPTTTSRSRSSSESSCSVSERSTEGAPTTGRPCERSQVCGSIRSVARSTATVATSR